MFVVVGIEMIWLPLCNWLTLVHVSVATLKPCKWHKYTFVGQSFAGLEPDAKHQLR